MSTRIAKNIDDTSTVWKNNKPYRVLYISWKPEDAFKAQIRLQKQVKADVIVKILPNRKYAVAVREGKSLNKFLHI